MNRKVKRVSTAPQRVVSYSLLVIVMYISPVCILHFVPNRIMDNEEKGRGKKQRKQIGVDDGKSTRLLTIFATVRAAVILPPQG